MLTSSFLSSTTAACRVSHMSLSGTSFFRAHFCAEPFVVTAATAGRRRCSLLLECASLRLKLGEVWQRGHQHCWGVPLCPWGSSALQQAWSSAAGCIGDPKASIQTSSCQVLLMGSRLGSGSGLWLGCEHCYVRISGCLPWR